MPTPLGVAGQLLREGGGIDVYIADLQVFLSLRSALELPPLSIFFMSSTSRSPMVLAACTTRTLLAHTNEALRSRSLSSNLASSSCDVLYQYV